MSEHKFKVGDVVQLKSGGPKMTVHGYQTKALAQDQEFVVCQWFAGSKMEMGSFPEASLDTVSPDKK